MGVKFSYLYITTYINLYLPFKFDQASNIFILLKFEGYRYRWLRRKNGFILLVIK